GESYTTGDIERHAFSWTREGGMIDLGTLGGSYSFAGAVNDSGQIVGDSAIATGNPRAFSWTSTGGMIDLGTLTLGGGTWAAAMNASGHVVGASSTGDGFGIHAFFWTPAGGMIDLGTLGGRDSLFSSV